MKRKNMFFLKSMPVLVEILTNTSLRCKNPNSMFSLTRTLLFHALSRRLLQSRGKPVCAEASLDLDITWCALLSSGPRSKQGVVVVCCRSFSGWPTQESFGFSLWSIDRREERSIMRVFDCFYFILVLYYISRSFWIFARDLYSSMVRRFSSILWRYRPLALAAYLSIRDRATGFFYGILLPFWVELRLMYLPS